MKVFAVQHNPCLLESVLETLSLHKTKKGAKKALAKRKRDEIKKYKQRNLTMPDWIVFRVVKLKVSE